MNTTRFAITKESLCKRIFAASAYMVRARESMGVPPAVGERMLITEAVRGDGGRRFKTVLCDLFNVFATLL